MAEYITSNDIQDNLLNVTEQDIAEANFFIEDIAGRMGVTPENIHTPLSFMVKRLTICFACYNRCLACVGTDATTTFDGGNRQDIYAQKLEFYKKEIEELKSKITKADFVGGVVYSGIISLWRS